MTCALFLYVCVISPLKVQKKYPMHEPTAELKSELSNTET